MFQNHRLLAFMNTLKTNIHMEYNFECFQTSQGLYVNELVFGVKKFIFGPLLSCLISYANYLSLLAVQQVIELKSTSSMANTSDSFCFIT